MSKAFDVITLGELNADLILTGDVRPVFGQVEKLIGSAELVLGSSSAIFACGAARLGLQTAMIGKVGNDQFGHFVIDELAARDVETRGIIVDPTVKTGLSIIFSQATDRAILTYAGSISMLRFAEIDQILLAQGRHLHLGGYFMLDALRPDIPRLFDLAHSLGLTVSLDTNYDPTNRWDGSLRDILACTDLFLPNETELCAIERSARAQALDLIASQVPMVAVKCGPRGAIARQGNASVEVSAVPVTVVDTTGAGDSFDAGFVYGYLRGWEMERALRFACACGALSTRAVGGTAAQPTIGEALGAL